MAGSPRATDPTAPRCASTCSTSARSRCRSRSRSRFLRIRGDDDAEANLDVVSRRLNGGERQVVRANGVDWKRGDRTRSGRLLFFPDNPPHVFRKDPPRRLRHRARELRPVVLPPHRARRDRGRAHAGVLDQQPLLGTLAATYFYVYTVLQIPVGVLADTLGPRRILAAGSLVAGIGSLAFALAPTWEIAAAGRTLVGIGVSVAFIAILKVSAVWFPANRFATLERRHDVRRQSRRGDRRRAARVARHADLVADVFVALAALSIALGVASWLRVRDRPEDLGFPAGACTPPHGSARMHWSTSVGERARAIRRRGPAFSSTPASPAAISRSPDCGPCRGSSTSTACRASTAAEHTSALLLGVAFGALPSACCRIGSATAAA